MKLLSAFTEDPDRVCKEVGIPLPNEEIGARDGLLLCALFIHLFLILEFVEGVKYCQICYDEDELLALPCGHAFCGGFAALSPFSLFFLFIDLIIECWNRYLSIEIKERSQSITCCGEGCNMVIDEFTVMNLLVSNLYFALTSLLNLVMLTERC